MSRTKNRRKVAPEGGLGTEISSLFAKLGFDGEIPELRGGNDRFVQEALAITLKDEAVTAKPRRSKRQRKN